MRGVEKTEIIDGKKVVGKKPNVPYVVNEIDKKTKKRRVYVSKLIGEEDLDDAMFCMISEMYDEIETDGDRCYGVVSDGSFLLVASYGP